VRRLPVWRRWLERALPHIAGPRVLEASFGTGYLLSQYASSVEAHGIDLNRRMIEIARRNLALAGVNAKLVRADVEHLPYRDDSFDTLVVTMAFSGYPEAERALREMKRVLRPGGRMVLIEHRPSPERRIAGDLVRDMGRLFDAHALDYREEEIGGWGSAHLFVATKREGPKAEPAMGLGAGSEASSPAD